MEEASGGPWVTQLPNPRSASPQLPGGTGLSCGFTVHRPGVLPRRRNGPVDPDAVSRSRGRSV